MPWCRNRVPELCALTTAQDRNGTGPTLLDALAQSSGLSNSCAHQSHESRYSIPLFSLVCVKVFGASITPHQGLHGAVRRLMLVRPSFLKSPRSHRSSQAELHRTNPKQLHVTFMQDSTTPQKPPDPLSLQLSAEECYARSHASHIHSGVRQRDSKT